MTIAQTMLRDSRFYWVRELYYRPADRWRKIRQAWGWATGRLSKDDMADMSWRIDQMTESYPLSTIDAADILRDLRDMYEDRPEFEQLASDAAYRVWNKWDGGSDREAATSWAMELVKEYAERDGVELKERE
jgi:hypothetical protein